MNDHHIDDVSSATFRLLPSRSRSQQDLKAKSCPAHNFVLWSRILQFCYVNDHHIETTCRALHLGRFLKVKVTAWPFSIIVSGPYYFIIWSPIKKKLFHINDHHVEMTCRAQHLGRYLEGQGHSMTFQQNSFRSITLLFEVGFYNYFWQTTSQCPIPIRGALPGSDRLLFFSVFIFFIIFHRTAHQHNSDVVYINEDFRVPTLAVFICFYLLYNLQVRCMV